MRTYKTPGVYVEEIATLPPSVVPVSTAIPAFIGYTEKSPSANIEVRRISSLTEYRALFGGVFSEPTISSEVEKGPTDAFYTVKTLPVAPGRPTYWLYYQLMMYFSNGGGSCYIVSVGTYKTTGTSIELAQLNKGLDALKKEDEPTLILTPDLMGVLPATPNATSLTNYYGHYQQAMLQCADTKDRFTIVDLHSGLEGDQVYKDFRANIGANNLSYGAAYFPWLETTFGFGYDESKVKIAGATLPKPAETMLRFNTAELASLPEVMDTQQPPKPLPSAQKQAFYEERSLFHIDNGAYTKIRATIESFSVTLPPSGAIAGIYAQVDNSRGVFKAPANVSLSNVIRPTAKIGNEQQADLNVHPTGKSINVIRSFSDKGILVWGARTLDGNSNEWRYISVRRLFIFLEESISKAVERFVFEPNTQNTWVSVKGTIENFLTTQWQAGALAGTTAQQAFFVNVGLGVTMTAQDILEGRLIIDVGVAAVRPAEFIILRFSHKLQEA
ncbi:MAG TPA: phage tail sheath C-terminal domain-containing protein [Haliscomenobacter sp.]|uniref:phage tail sheath family protein n=1 Tax=Haliscomenobacter sp. TaxID=2717303 RepID=UPI002D119BA6|nr:phage tail sheath C-terminal domain-containing protein [Haliscomenobacter sp.]HOY16511.1 phage tail sheath C-terminal domain-containing protein [Haliscomenobacter sp.]